MINGFFLNCTNSALSSSGSLKMLGKALIALLFLLTQAGLVQAATYCVATTGSDSNTGTQSSPFRTIKKAISVLYPGDTLYIRGGNYDEDIDSGKQTIPAGASWSSVITITAYSGESVTIKRVSLWHPHVRYLVFLGLIIDGRNTAIETVYLSGGANHIRFKNCEIKNGYGQGYSYPPGHRL